MWVCTYVSVLDEVTYHGRIVPEPLGHGRNKVTNFRCVSMSSKRIFSSLVSLTGEGKILVPDSSPFVLSALHLTT